MELGVLCGCFFFFRRVLWERRCGSTQHRRYDGCFNGSNRVHEVHRRTLYGFKEIKVRLNQTDPLFCWDEMETHALFLYSFLPLGKVQDPDAKRNVKSDQGGKGR